VYSRYVVGWLLATCESAELAEELVAATCAKQGIRPEQLTLHADRGSVMRAITLAQMLSDLAVGLWLYHGAILHSDNRAAAQEQFSGLSTLQVAILSGNQPALMERLHQGLQQKLPELRLHPLLTADSLPGEIGPDMMPEATVLTQANVIISPATLALHNDQAEVASAVAGSPAYKLFIPVSQPDSLWLGVEKMDETAVIKQTVQVIRQIAIGGSVHPARSLGLAPILVLVVAGGFMLLCFFLSVVAILINSGLF
jgi:hypothetical protein